VLRDPTDDDDWLLRERRRIGRHIRDARVDRNLTQEQVLLAVPLARSFYQEIESGQANPTVDTLLRIARVLDMHIADLLRY
jgi:transcriptional regulator with XRE-family HTH domain